MYFLHTIYIFDYQLYNCMKIIFKINSNTLSGFVLTLMPAFANSESRPFFTGLMMNL
jgi:hypothetical protein